MSQKLNLKLSEAMYESAQKIIPGAVAGIRRPYNFVPGEYPIYFDHAKGGKVTDVDGNEYIDMLCAYGPIIIGHREEEIDNAVIEQIQNKGFCFSLTQPVQNKLAQKLIDLIPSAEMAVFVKTGSDATSVAIRVARANTERTKVVRCGYHGWHDWCVEVKGGIPKKLYEDIFEFHYNQLDELEDIMKVHGDDMAAIIITPVGHPLAEKVQMPNPGFLEGVRALADKYGTILVFDEIRSGFRFGLGGAQKEFGVTPDLSVFGKAMANGYPIGSVVGKEKYMKVLADKVFLSSTFYPNSLEQIAALKTIEILERDNILGEIKRKGNLFGERLHDIARNCEFEIEISGVPFMPFVTFKKDAANLYKKLRPAFYTELIRKGVFLQPYHHGYVAYRHSDADLMFAADMIDESLKEIKKYI
jgi:glutamate-1-semialdehyde aminotransferase